MAKKKKLKKIVKKKKKEKHALIKDKSIVWALVLGGALAVGVILYVNYY